MAALDAGAFADCFEPRAMAFAPVGGAPLEGHAALAEFIGDLAVLFQRLEWRYDHVVVAPDSVAVKWTASGTRRDGRDADFEGIDVFEVSDGPAIRTLWSYWDPSAMTWSDE